MDYGHMELLYRTAVDADPEGQSIAGSQHIYLGE